jgi:hypothetical protein
MSLMSNLMANGDCEVENAKNDISSVEKKEVEVHQLARRFTGQITYSTAEQNPFAAESGRPWTPIVSTSMPGLGATPCYRCT